MGIDKLTLEFLLDTRRNGVELKNVITLGRQDLLMEYSAIEDLFTRYNISFTENSLIDLYKKNNQFAEPLLEYIGAESCKSIDNSDYESASIVHDLNNAIGDDLKGQYDTVIDGGTLEHVFNFPQAIKNCMELVKVGGHFISITPSNNQLGHGFYQLSPELLFRVFSEENGFKVKRMIYYEYNDDDVWYEVQDPKIVSHRVETKSLYPSSLMLVAEKIENRNIFEKTPQQSDYENEWTYKGDKGDSVDRLSFWRGKMTPSKKGLFTLIKRNLKLPLKILRRYIFKKLVIQPKGLLPNQKYFIPYKKL